jgi:hypothetical protein
MLASTVDEFMNYRGWKEAACFSTKTKRWKEAISVFDEAVGSTDERQ